VRFAAPPETSQNLLRPYLAEAEPTSLRPPIAQKCSRTGIVSLYSARYANPVKIISSTSNSALAAVNPYS
jgi:hypothetical protein